MQSDRTGMNFETGGISPPFAGVEACQGHDPGGVELHGLQLPVRPGRRLHIWTLSSAG